MKTLLLSLTTLFLLLSPLIARAAELRWTANVGYDLISQEFFEDSLTLAGADSSVIEWQLQKDYLDDLQHIVSKYTHKYGAEPKIRVITHSHGGNIILNGTG